jgi:aminopeptidase N
MPLTIGGKEAGTTTVLELTESEQSFVFENVREQPTPSILRDFSAPIVLDLRLWRRRPAAPVQPRQRPVNRWEAGQRLAMGRLLKLTGEAGVDAPLNLDDTFLMALGKMLTDETLDPAFREQALLLPSEGMVAEQIDVVNPLSIHLARQFMRANIGARLRTELLAQYQANQTPGEYSPDALSAGKRALKNLCLAYLTAAQDEEGLALAQRSSTRPAT